MSFVPPGQLVVRSGSNPVSLGAIVFSSEETPIKWNVGSGEQMLVTTDLPGGGRIVQDFGNSAAEVTWSGILWGPNIPLRVQQLREYRVSGQPQPLIWGNEKYLVKIKSFNPGYRGGYCEYEISCVVVQDMNGAFAVQPSTSVDQDVANIQSQAIVQQNGVAQVDPAGNTAYGQQLANLWQGIQNASPLAQNLVTQGPALIGLASTAITAIQTYQATISQTSTQYPYTVGLVASLQALISNFQNGPTQTSVQIPGGELFSVAAMQYGDITRAFSIAQANGFVYPILPTASLRQISIPPLQQAA